MSSIGSIEGTARRKVRSTRLASAVLVGLALPLVGVPAPTPEPLPTVAPPAPAPRLPELPPEFQQAAAAIRERRCDRAISLLEPFTTGDGTESPLVSLGRLVQGLYAHACEDVALAQERLLLGGGRDTPLEDWRLLVLSDSAAASGQPTVARSAVEKVLERYPASPLRFHALEKAARLAWEDGDPARAREVTRRAWNEPAPAAAIPLLVRLDLVAWEQGKTAGGEPRFRREVARHLLVHAPVQAVELGIEKQLEAALLGGPGLTPGESRARARRLLDATHYGPAWQALQAVPEEGRGVDWYLLAAESQTRARRGGDALALLASVSAPTPELQGELEWARALAARDLATAASGRRNLPFAQRQQHRRAMEDHLRRTARWGTPETATPALRLLFAELAADERFEEALAALKALRELDATDTTGAQWLWGRGWAAYNRRDYTRAIGFWAELTDLYPRSRHSRSSQYWSGRSFEYLGNRHRARELYRALLAADTADFYHRYAQQRLGEEPEPLPQPSPEPWPDEPLLERARLLTDLGLEELAMTELAALRDRAPAGSVAALESLILSRQREHRASATLIPRAFPALGTAHQRGLPKLALELYYPLAYEEQVRQSAARVDLPLPLVLGMIRQESAFDRHARSRAGARGLMQLMPATGREVARRIGLPFSYLDLEDPAFNTRLGTHYFRQVLDLFDGNVELALAGYNGGPYRIQRLWRQADQREMDLFLEALPVEESRTYVKRILVLADTYRWLYQL